MRVVAEGNQRQKENKIKRVRRSKYMEEVKEASVLLLQGEKRGN